MAVKKTISVPPELAKKVEEIAREEKKPISAIIQDALRIARKELLKAEFYQVQNYWSRKAKEKRVLTEKDLERYLKPSESYLTQIYSSLHLRFPEAWREGNA